MRVPHNSEIEINIDRARSRDIEGETLKTLKYSTSIERNIEKLSRKAETLGWSYTDFCTHVLEVLAVLQHRRKVKRQGASRRRGGTGISV